MKVGSLVECVDPFIGDEEAAGITKGFYHIREFDVSFNGNLLIRVEEIINPKGIFIEGFKEPAYGAQRFREVEIPGPLEEEIKEALAAPIKEPKKQLTEEDIKELIEWGEGK